MHEGFCRGSRLALANAKSKTGVPLFLAASRGHEAATRALLQARADVSARDVQGSTLLHCAAEGGLNPKPYTLHLAPYTLPLNP